MLRKMHTWSTVFAGLALVGMLITPWMALVRAGIETQMGLAQKIFYYHVPSAFMMYAGYIVCAVASALYLWKREKRFDIWAACGAEVGLVFAVIVLTTGPIWARPIWNAWWVWDAQLTLFLVLFLTFVAYMMLKGYSDESIQSAKYRAVLAIIGVINIPLIHYSVQLWRTHHPKVIRQEKMGLPDDMYQAFLACVFTFVFLFLAILLKRVSLEKARDELEYIRAEVRDRRALLGQHGNV